MFSFTKNLWFLLLFSFGWLSANAQVTADFSINYPSPVCNPSVISFTDMSTGVAPLSYEWNFGVNPGVNSILQNPSTTYSDCGTFTVTLTTTNGLGQKSLKKQLVTINCRPVANFIVSATSGCYPLTVQFTSTSTPGSGVLTSYLWDFGDGAGGTGANPSHTYTAGGCKTVTLVVTNSKGCSDDSTRVQTVCVTDRPTIDFTATPTTSCSAPLTSAYAPTVTGGLSPYTYHWVLNGGSPANSAVPNPSVDYKNAGSFGTQLFVTDANGCTDTVIKNNYITVGSNTADFSISATKGCAPLTVNASGIASAGAQSWSWTTAPAATPATANTQNASFTFTTPGSYQVCLTITYNGGCTAQKCTTVVVYAVPKADFNASGDSVVCKPPLEVTYNDKSVGNNLTYNWNFPGGKPLTSTAQNPGAVNYFFCGSYDASLTVTNAGGCSDTKSMANFVSINCPKAAFIAIPPQGCLPLSVQFNSGTSSGNPTQWEWNFGDAANKDSIESTAQNPNHIFTQAGCYDVRLVIKNSQGCSDTLLSTSAVCVGAIPNVHFTANPSVICVGQPVTFTNLTTGTNAQTTYGWNFVHVPPYTVQSTASNPMYSYADTGRMDVTLIVCNSGCCDTLTIDSMIDVLDPVAKFSVTRDCTTPYTLALNGMISKGATSYVWDLTGGTPSYSTDSIVTVSYPLSGAYTIKLSVTNALTGCTNTKVQTVQIRKIKADFTIANSASCKPFTACMTNTSVDASSSAWTITDTIGNTIFAATQLNICPILQTPGNYNVRLVSTDVNGCKDTIAKPKFLTVYGNVVNFTATPTSGCRPLTVQFNDASSSTTSFATAWKWMFGDPSSGNQNSSVLRNPTHTYNKPGSYSVTLSVIDNHGCLDSLKQINIVKVNEPVISFSVDSTICSGSPACFANHSQGNSLTYNWDFGDGTTSTKVNPCHIYPADGYYNVTLKATDAGGCSATFTDTAVLNVSHPTANFIADTTKTTCPPLPVNFTNLSSGVDSLATYHWNFGDGSFSTVKDPFHFYNKAGIFDVTLITTNRQGCSDTIIFPKYIDISGPSGTAFGTPTSGCNPLNVCFHATTINTQGYSWNFGDGTVTSNKIDSVCYTYTLSGKFFPQVILSDGLGCSVGLPLGTITIGTPGVKFVMSDDSVCRSGTIQFTDSSHSAVPITSWTWDFGDPSSGASNSSSVQNPSHFFSGSGMYPVTLNVMTQIGCGGFYKDTVYVIDPPAALFTISKPAICPGSSVTFTDKSQSAGQSTRVWNFGDPGSGASNTSIAKNPSHTFSIPGSYLVTLIVTNGGGCMDTSTGNVTVNQNPIAAAGNDASVCINSSATLGASGGVNYLWKPSTGLNDSTISSPVTTPVLTTTYTVLVTDVNGCTATDNMVVTVNALPVIHTGNDTMICPGLATQLLATGGVSYSWSPLDGLNNAGIANPLANPTSTETYIVTGTDGNGCTGVASVIITVAPAPIANAGPDTAICEGQTTSLNGTGGLTFSWSPATVSDPFISNPIATPSSTTTYTLTVTDINQCSATDQVIATVHPTPNVDAGPDVQICSGNSGVLNGSGAESYNWTPTFFLNNNFVANPTTTPDSGIIYYLTGTDAFGCTAWDSVTVSVLYPVKAQVGPGATICYGEVVHLSASGGTEYHWTPSIGLDNPFIANPIAGPKFTLQYKVVVSDGICSRDSGYVTVTVNPLAYCDAGNDKTTSAGSKVTLNASAGFGTYSWSPPDGLSCTDCLNPIVTATHDTTYILTVTNPAGCRSEDTVHITVACIEDVIYVPNSFTPNGDNKDETFRLRSYGLKELKYLRVFNRWGELMFESNDIEKGWDGKYKGVNATPGVYVYYIDAVCSSGEKIQKQGNVTLIR